MLLMIVVKLCVLIISGLKKGGYLSGGQQVLVVIS